MKILHKKIELGESVQLGIDSARLYTRTSVNVPVIVERGKKDGPCLLLVGGIHGDEVNGVEIVRSIIEKGFNKPEVGTVICIPLVNVFGFLNQSRQFPDGRDLNRVFPGSQSGSLPSQFAHQIMKDIIPDVDYCIDYHTGGSQRFNAPQLRINGTDPEVINLAKIFGAPYVLFAKNREKSFRESLTKAGKKAMLYEGGKSLNIDSEVTKVGVQGALNIMHHLGMRDFSPQMLKPSETNEPIFIKRSTWIRAKHSGMYRPSVKLGQNVEKGMKLGTICDPFGAFTKVFKNPQKGHVICLNESPLVHQGDALFHIGFDE